MRCCASSPGSTPTETHARVRPVIRTVVAVLVVVAALGPSAADARLTARGSVEQVQVTGVKGGALVTLLRPSGAKLKAQRADPLGGALFRNVKPGRGYRVRAGGARSAALTVMTTRSAPPGKGFYKQSIPKPGYGYLTTRDGTKLAIDVYVPSGSGPY